VGGQEITTTFELPLTETTDINTRVLIPDQGTVVLGGLTLTSEREVEAGVPILSKIPILGRFFSNRSEVKDKQILLILVKPTIVLKDEVEQRAVSALEGAG
jgi:type II secretory pathway component GspD/PulD (secretin)